MFKTKSFLLFLTGLLALPKTSDMQKHKIGLKQDSGIAPFNLELTAPQQLINLGKGKYQKWTGCGYLIFWGDGPYSTSPQGPIGTNCATGFRHTYKTPGTFLVKAKIYHLGPADEMQIDWSDQVQVKVLKRH